MVIYCHDSIYIYTIYTSLLEPIMWQLNKIVVPVVVARWIDVAYNSLHYDIPEVEAIEAKHNNNPKECCRELFKDWLTTNNGITPKSWQTLVKQLEEVEDLAASVEKIKAQILRL